MKLKSLDQISPGVYRLGFDNDTVAAVSADLLTEFENGWTLFHLHEAIMGRAFTMILIHASSGQAVVPTLQRTPFTLKPDLHGECPRYPKMRYRDCYYCWHQMEHPDQEPPPV